MGEANASILASDTELDQIIAELETGMKRLPKTAIARARECRDVIVPKLIEVLHRATAAARAGEKPTGNAHFFALFLLTEFKATEALPAIVEAVSLPGDLPFDLFGDAITSVVARVLVTLAGDRWQEVVDGLIRNRELNEYVRWEAAQSYTYLARDGRLSRGEAVAKLQRLLREAIDGRDCEIVTPLINVLSDFAPREARDDIVAAYRDGLVEEFMIRLEDIDESIAEGDEHVRREFARLETTAIEDTIKELSHWASFQEESRARPSSRPLPVSAAPKGSKVAVTTAPPPEPDRPRVGRNDPCPCGSGMKFKKCCGRTRAA